MNFSVNPTKNTPVLSDPSNNLIHSGGGGGGWILPTLSYGGRGHRGRQPEVKDD